MWDLATGAPVGDPFTGHTGAVKRWRSRSWGAARWWSPAAATATVRVWDLATGDAGRRPVHRRTPALVHAVAVAELDGRPVVISGSGDGTVRVWDLATGAPVGDPFTGHTELG